MSISLKELKKNRLTPDEKWLLELIDGVKPRKYGNDSKNVYWYKNGECLFGQNFKNKQLWVTTKMTHGSPTNIFFSLEKFQNLVLNSMNYYIFSEDVVVHVSAPYILLGDEIIECLKTQTTNKISLVKLYSVLLEAEQFVLTGSLALSLFGLCDRSKVGDIDIILYKPTESTLNKLRYLVSHYAKHEKLDGTYESNTNQKIYCFKHEQTNIDVFISNKSIKTKSNFKTIGLSKTRSIILAKIKLNRKKDWGQIYNIFKKLIGKLWESH